MKLWFNNAPQFFSFERACQMFQISPVDPMLKLHHLVKSREKTSQNFVIWLGRDQDIKIRVVLLLKISNYGCLLFSLLR